MLAFAATNGVAARAALCQHEDARAHIAALTSSDAAIAAAAHGEESADAAADKSGTLVDAAAASLAGLLIPPRTVIPAPALAERQPARPVEAPDLTNRSIAPLLQPPLG